MNEVNNCNMWKHAVIPSVHLCSSVRLALNCIAILRLARSVKINWNWLIKKKNYNFFFFFKICRQPKPLVPSLGTVVPVPVANPSRRPPLQLPGAAGRSEHARLSSGPPGGRAVT